MCLWNGGGGLAPVDGPPCPAPDLLSSDLLRSSVGMGGLSRSSKEYPLPLAPALVMLVAVAVVVGGWGFGGDGVSEGHKVV